MSRCPSLEFRKRPGLERFTVGTRGDLSRSLAVKSKKVPRSREFRTQKRLQCVYMLMGGCKPAKLLSSPQDPGSRRPPGLIHGDHFQSSQR